MGRSPRRLAFQHAGAVFLGAQRPCSKGPFRSEINAGKFGQISGKTKNLEARAAVETEPSLRGRALKTRRPHSRTEFELEAPASTALPSSSAAAKTAVVWGGVSGGGTIGSSGKMPISVRRPQPGLADDLGRHISHSEAVRGPNVWCRWPFEFPGSTQALRSAARINTHLRMCAVRSAAQRGAARRSHAPLGSA